MILLCQACFNGADAVARDSLNAGIVVLLGVTGLVLASLGAFFLYLARQSRAAGPQPAPDAPSPGMAVLGARDPRAADALLREIRGY